MKSFSAAVVFMLLPVAAAAGQQPERSHLADLVADAVSRNPSIAAARLAHDAAVQRVPQARSLPDPMLSAGYNSSGRPWPGAGLGVEPTANIGLMISQPLPYPGKRDLRAAIAARDADAERQQVEAARLAVESRVRQAYYRLAYAHAASAAVTRNQSLLETILHVSEQRYAVGGASQQDVIRAQTQLTMLELQRERLTGERRNAEFELNALCDRPAETPIAPPDDLTLVDLPSVPEALASAAERQAPVLLRDAALVDRAQAAVASARREYKPDLAVSGGYYEMGSMPSMYEFRFDITLPLRRVKRDAGVAEQVALQQQAANVLSADRLDVRARIAQEYQSAGTALRLARLYRDTALPQARLALESSMSSYQTGRLDFLSVITNFGAVLDEELAYYEQLASLHASLARLDELAGASLH